MQLQSMYIHTGICCIEAHAAVESLELKESTSIPLCWGGRSKISK